MSLEKNDLDVEPQEPTRTPIPHGIQDKNLDEKPTGTTTSSTKTIPPASTGSQLASDVAIAEDGDEDLEELTAVRTGPPYSVFSKRQKQYLVFMVTVAAFISPTSANIYFPALNPLAKDLNVSDALINVTLTSFMIFQGIAPTFIGDFADMAGRRPAYIVASIIYLGANIGLALQNSFPALLVLRCLQSAGSSGGIALGYGVVADISTSSERGSYVGIVGAGTMLGPALGPVIGGILAQFLGWRSIFWFCFIFAAVWLIPFILTVPETGRNVVGNGSVPPIGWNMTVLDYLRQRKELKSQDSLSRSATADERRRAQAELASHRKLKFPNPLKTIHIITEKDVALVLIYNSLIYTAFYDVIASMPVMFKQTYGFNDLEVGLCYLPFGFGCAVTSFLNGKLLDRNYKRIAKRIGFAIDRKHGDDLRYFPIEEARIGIMWPILSVGLASIMCYGWAMEMNAPLAAPLVLTFLIGFCVNGSFNILSTLMVDLYPQSPATATAANNLVRCFMGAGGTGIINIMVEKMGRGWCFTFISLVCTVTMPMLLAEIKWGPGWREERQVRLDAKAAADHRKKMEESNDALAIETGQEK
ncbi:hypothetical protein V493_05055 [Pseudogymnoascus sp. VKM F-4281 (FW-2241)]|nr:hypothetical protein V493_05055 [Pseudogymnoascus sp. VKM F-4281 (FW-2241)]